MESFKIDENQELIKTGDQWVLHKNGIPRQDTPSFLYKYFPLNEYSLDALEKGYFYLNNPKNFNDPFDCSYNLIEGNVEVLQDWQHVELPNDVANKGICCFSANGMNPLMWGHYTNSYHGFVVKYVPKFNFIYFEKEIGLTKILPVTYSENPRRVPPNSPFANQYQLTIKLKDWEYEEEYRLIAEKNSTALTKLYFDISAISEIFIGYKMYNNEKEDHCNLRNKFEQIIKKKYNAIPLFCVTPDQKEFRLSKVPFREGNLQDVEDLLGL